jgi:hypothetical protein
VKAVIEFKRPAEKARIHCRSLRPRRVSATVPVLHFVALPSGCIRARPRRLSAPQFAQAISARSIIL